MVWSNSVLKNKNTFTNTKVLEKYVGDDLNYHNLSKDTILSALKSHKWYHVTIVNEPENSLNQLSSVILKHKAMIYLLSLIIFVLSALNNSVQDEFAQDID